MSQTPRFKIYTAQGEYVAACKYAEDAAVLISVQQKGSSIRDGHSKRDIVWHEGFEDKSAAESYDYVAHLIQARLALQYNAAQERINASMADQAHRQDVEQKRRDGV